MSVRISDSPMAWWAARPVIAALPFAHHEAGEMVVEPILHDRLVLAIQGAGQVELEHYGGVTGWWPLVSVGPWSGAYVGVALPVNVVLGIALRLRWSAGTFAVTLSALPPRTMIKNPEGETP